MHHERSRAALTISTILALLAFPVSSRAGDPQTGGLPALADRVQLLEGLTQSLQQAVETLQSNVAALQSANTNLQSALNAEIAARAAADTTLQAALTREATLRDSADSALQTQIGQEATTRLLSDKALGESIAANQVNAYSIYHDHAGLVGGNRAAVGTIGPLPAGNYLVTGKVTASNFIHDTVWSCYLQRDDGVFIDRTDSDTTTAALGGSGGSTAIVNVALTTLSAPGSISMLCESQASGSDLFDVSITATQVGQATIACNNIGSACAN